MKELIPFNEWSQKRIDQGRKCLTSRHKKYTKDPRVMWILPRLPWQVIRDYFWREEGADSPDELQKVIEEIHKRKVPDDEVFYPHFGDYAKKID